MPNKKIPGLTIPINARETILSGWLGPSKLKNLSLPIPKIREDQFSILFLLLNIYCFLGRNNMIEVC